MPLCSLFLHSMLPYLRPSSAFFCSHFSISILCVGFTRYEYRRFQLSCSFIVVVKEHFQSAHLTWQTTLSGEPLLATGFMGRRLFSLVHLWNIGIRPCGCELRRSLLSRVSQGFAVCTTLIDATLGRIWSRQYSPVL